MMQISHSHTDHLLTNNKPESLPSAGPHWHLHFLSFFLPSFRTSDDESSTTALR